MLMSAIGLRSRGHKVYFGGRKGSKFLSVCSENNFPIFELSIKGDFGLINIFKLTKYFRKNSINIIIANFNKDIRLSVLAAKFSPVQILLARNGLPILQNNWRYRLTYTRLVDGIITNTNAIKSRYLSYGWLSDDFIKVIHNGIDTSQKVDYPRDQVIREYNLPKERKFVGIFGRLVKQKQHHVFLEIARKIKNELPQVRFLIIGDGPLKQELDDTAKELGLENEVIFISHLSNPFPLYTVCDVVLLTSEEEGFPNVVMEAMLSAKPVVAFNVGGVGELIETDKTGFITRPDNQQEMFLKAIELLKNPQLCQEIGQNARKYVLENLSLDKMIDQIESYLEFQLERKSLN